MCRYLDVINDVINETINYVINDIIDNTINYFNLISKLPIAVSAVDFLHPRFPQAIGSAHQLHHVPWLIPPGH